MREGSGKKGSVKRKAQQNKRQKKQEYYEKKKEAFSKDVTEL